MNQFYVDRAMKRERDLHWASWKCVTIATHAKGQRALREIREAAARAMAIHLEISLLFTVAARPLAWGLLPLEGAR